MLKKTDKNHEVLLHKNKRFLFLPKSFPQGSSFAMFIKNCYRLISILIVFTVILTTTSCAKPIGPSWPEVSPGMTPETMSATPNKTTATNFGERTPADKFSGGGDPSAGFASSTPPGYNLPEESTSEEPYEENTTTQNPEPNKYDVSSSPDGKTSEDFIDPVEDWLIQDGITLQQLLKDWCDRAGWRLVWKSERDYIIEAGAMLRGRFIDVSSAVVRNMARAKPAPIATFFKGNRVLIVETLEDENAY